VGKGARYEHVARSCIAVQPRGHDAADGMDKAVSKGGSSNHKLVQRRAHRRVREYFQVDPSREPKQRVN